MMCVDDVDWMRVVMLLLERLRRMVVIDTVFVFSLNEYAVVRFFANYGPGRQVVSQEKILENFTQLR